MSALEQQPEPTADLEAKSATIIEPELTLEADFIMEFKPNAESFKVCELAAMSVIEGMLMEFMEME